MPRHSVVNRRNISDFTRRSVSVTDEAMAAVTALAEALHVSQGSVADVAFRHLSTLTAAEVTDLLHLHGHLTDKEYTVVVAIINDGGN
jgi:hypothetical protein